jgi:outer membrane receptor protein involved in Fe transport
MKVAVFSGNTTFNVENAADANTRGIELDSRWKLADRVNLSVGAAYTDFEFKRFPNQACTNAQFLAYRQALFTGSLGPAAAALTAADCAAAGVNDLAGRTTVDAPKFSASVRLDAEQPIGSFALKGALDYNANAAADRFNVLQGKMV